MLAAFVPTDRSMSPIAPTKPAHAWLKAFGVLLVVAAINLAIWAVTHRPRELPDSTGKIAGLAFSAFQRYQSPHTDQYPDEAEIEADIKLMARYAPRIRNYSAAESPLVPAIAEKYGLKLMAGAWLDRRWQKNEDEIAALIKQIGEHSNIERAIVGNEVLLRADMEPEELMQYIERVRGSVGIPVSAAEPWHVWLKYPELANHVDFICVHLLPYWEGVPSDYALTLSLERYDLIRKTFPDKHVVVGEIGWPSNGDRVKAARATKETEATFLRQFFEIARQRNIDYYVMEAFDQPWKVADEGRAGAYWGMFDAFREAKFPLVGPVQEDPNWPLKALAAGLLALPFVLGFARKFTRFAVVGLVFYGTLIQLAASLLVWQVTLPFAFYLDPVDWAMLGVLLPAQLAILGILLCNAFEFTEAIWRPVWVRGATVRHEPDRKDWPFVSIHLACHNEPPEMVIATLDSLAELDYEDFEVLVLDNNTAREEVWKPVEARCAELGPRFRFFHLAPWPGFKAGALNYGLTQTDPRAEIVGAVDADYVVRKDWLRGLVGYFDNPKVGIVQLPQAHRDFEHNAFRRMTNWEYDGFFRIGMHHRNERNAIIQHGTMTLIRKQALVDTGNWAEWCICEDAELGLRLFHAGLEAVYVDEPIGRGLTPADFTAFKSQRFRWAFGAMQILRGHLDWLLGRSPLTWGQRFHFLTGWFSWFADALHLVFTIASLAWTIGLIAQPGTFTLPLNLFVVPVLGFFVCKAVFGIILYRVRVPCSWRDTISAAIASMSLSHAIARGILKGLVSKEHPFTRTAKSRRLRSRPNAFSAIREELLLLIALVLGAFGVLSKFGTDHLEAVLWTSILLAQAIPYVSAVICAYVAWHEGEKI